MDFPEGQPEDSPVEEPADFQGEEPADFQGEEARGRSVAERREGSQPMQLSSEKQVGAAELRSRSP